MLRLVSCQHAKGRHFLVY